MPQGWFARVFFSSSGVASCWRVEVACSLVVARGLSPVRHSMVVGQVQTALVEQARRLDSLCMERCRCDGDGHALSLSAFPAGDCGRQGV